MMTFTKKLSPALAILVLVILLMPAGVVQGSESVTMANGLRVHLYGAAEIAAQPSLCGIPLAATDARYVPYDEDHVLAALEAMHGFHVALDVDVYLLPAPPAAVASSYASGNNIYLAPGTGTIAASTQAYIVTHEMGHVLTWAFMDNSSSRWSAYMELRGLSNEDNGPSAAHANRAREIVAEDFRHLFGGNLATSTGSIENPALELPDRVDGLMGLLSGFLAERPTAEVMRHAAKAFPNPCNPRTTISLELPSGTVGQVRLDIFDARGHRVRSIDGGRVQGGNVMVDWNGNDDRGTGVASGRYLYVLRAGTVQAQGSLTLVR